MNLSEMSDDEIRRRMDVVQAKAQKTIDDAAKPKTAEVQKWADRSMYLAQPIEPGGPKVVVLSCNPDPLGSVAMATMTYEGKFPGGLHEITDEQRRFYLDDVQKAKRWAPLEFVNIHFLISGVSRTFTHQLVRQRTAAYAQESMRFAVKESVPVHQPSSLVGTMSWDDWYRKCVGELFPQGSTAMMTPETLAMLDKYMVEQASQAQLWRREWDAWMNDTESSYNALIDAGMPAEDVREGLPVGTLTRIHYTTDLRYLLEHCGQRLCTQAQYEWKQVWQEIMKALKAFGSTQTYRQPELQKKYIDGGPGVENRYAPDYIKSSAWQFDELVNIFKPICYQTGKCEFNSSADRFCAIKERVNGFAELGIPSTAWGSDMQVKGVGPRGIPNDRWIRGIDDSEWMNNHASARISQ